MLKITLRKKNGGFAHPLGTTETHVLSLHTLKTYHITIRHQTNVFQNFDSTNVLLLTLPCMLYKQGCY